MGTCSCIYQYEDDLLDEEGRSFQEMCEQHDISCICLRGLDPDCLYHLEKIKRLKMRDHILTVKEDQFFDPEDPDYNLSIQCNTTHEPGTECNAWVRCETCRRSINNLVSLGRDDEVMEMEDKAVDGKFIHGEPHIMIEYDICIESNVCVLQSNDSWEQWANEDLQEYGPGEYYIDFECDEYSVSILDYERKID